MKLTRLFGAAAVCGVWFGSVTTYAQIPYNFAANKPISYPSPVAPTGPPTYYPSTNGSAYAVASVPTPSTQFGGPTNAPVTRLPSSGPETSLVGHPPTLPHTDPNYPQPSNSVLTSPPPAGNSGYGGSPNLGGNQPDGGNQPVYGSGAYGAGMAPDYGSGMAGGIGGGVGPIGAPTGAAGASCGVGGPGLQPFSGANVGVGTGGGYIGPNLWYAGAYGLVLTRNSQEHYTFSYDTGNEAIQYTDAKNADVGYGGGLAAVIGRYFNCGQNAVEAVFWGWYPQDVRSNTYGANAIGDLNGIFNWDSLTYNGQNAGAFVNNAAVHSLYRQTEANNVEVNILSFSGGYGSAYGPSNLRFTWLAGVRNFRFRDDLMFSSDPNDTNINGDVDELNYLIKTTNNLTGFQLGGVGTYCVGQRLSLNAGTKVGLYGNHITHTSQIYGTAGTAVINNGPNAGQAFYVNNSKNDVSFLTELFVGFGYCITDHWSASAGYRAIAVTGLASPTDQIYPDLRGINDLQTIESSSSMILHGAYFGAQYCF